MGRLERCDGSMARELLCSLEPWIAAQRWAPQSAVGLTPQALWKLASGIYILVARAQDGTTLQLPVTTRVNSDGVPVPSDASASPEFWKAWINQCDVVSGNRQDLLASASRVQAFPVEQSNTSVILSGGEKPLIAKIFRVLQPGTHPEVELPSALSGAGWDGVPAVKATWYLPALSPGEPRSCSAVISAFLVGARDGFDYFVDLAGRDEDPTSAARNIGAVVASLHNHLERDFGAQEAPSTTALHRRVSQALAALANVDGALDADIQSAVQQKIDSPEFLPTTLESPRIRVHGDLHLGQLLAAEGASQWVVVDFEGEPLRPLDSRRERDLAMRDVAGVLRSFDYAGAKGKVGNPQWVNLARQAFLEGYDRLRPIKDQDRAALAALELEKALYEVAYESKYRPTWLPIPRAAVSRLVEDVL